MFVRVKHVRAHVRNGQIVLDEPVDLPEGVELEVRVLSEEPDRNELETAVEEGAADFDRGEFEDARELATRLAAR
jgi:hypothetical protein